MQSIQFGLKPVKCEIDVLLTKICIILILHKTTIVKYSIEGDELGLGTTFPTKYESKKQDL